MGQAFAKIPLRRMCQSAVVGAITSEVSSRYCEQRKLPSDSNNLLPEAWIASLRSQ
jgi:hypothetical protein